MIYYHENEQSTTTKNNIDECYYCNVDGKRPKQKSLYYIISFIKKVQKQAKKKPSVLLEFWIVVIFGSTVTAESTKGYPWSCFISGSEGWLYEYG